RRVGRRLDHEAGWRRGDDGDDAPVRVGREVRGESVGQVQVLPGDSAADGVDGHLLEGAARIQLDVGVDTEPRGLFLHRGFAGLGVAAAATHGQDESTYEERHPEDTGHGAPAFRGWGGEV